MGTALNDIMFHAGFGETGLNKGQRGRREASVRMAASRWGPHLRDGSTFHEKHAPLSLRSRLLEETFAKQSIWRRIAEQQEMAFPWEY